MADQASSTVQTILDHFWIPQALLTFCITCIAGATTLITPQLDQRMLDGLAYSLFTSIFVACFAGAVWVLIIHSRKVDNLGQKKLVDALRCGLATPLWTFMQQHYAWPLRFLGVSDELQAQRLMIRYWMLVLVLLFWIPTAIRWYTLWDVKIPEKNDGNTEAEVGEKTEEGLDEKAAGHCPTCRCKLGHRD